MFRVLLSVVEYPDNEHIADKEMQILGFRINWFRSGRRRRSKVTSKLDKIANAALLDAAVKSPEVLAQVINKFGQIEIYQDDEIETKIQNLKTKIHREAAET